jgi:hypothetical protein
MGLQAGFQLVEPTARREGRLRTVVNKMVISEIYMNSGPKDHVFDPEIKCQVSGVVFSTCFAYTFPDT